MGTRLVAIRYAWAIAVVVATLPPLARALTLRGLYRPILVSSESMTPTLWGPSWGKPCTGCGIPLRFVVSPSDRTPPVCFNCGARCSGVTSPIQPGDRVLIDTASYRLHRPQRFDLVAVQSADGSIEVKRILAGPGERVAFGGGDLFIDGKRTSRPIADVLRTAIDVCDDRYRNANQSRWIADGTAGWEQLDHGFRSVGTSGKRSDPVIYEHRLVYRGNRPHRVMDDYPQNQHLSRQMNPVNDLIVRFRCQASSDTRIHVAIHASDTMVLCTFVRAREHWVIVSGPKDDLHTHRLPVTDDAVSLVVAFIDGWPWAGTEGQMRRIGVDPSSTGELGLSPLRPIAISCTSSSGQSVILSDLRVQRDLHWFELPIANPPTRAPLGPSSYFVIGDNVPTSRDSRHQSEGVPRQAIIGRVIPIR